MSETPASTTPPARPASPAGPIASGAPAPPAGPTPLDMTHDEERRRRIGRALSLGIMGGAAVAVVVALLQWVARPQTDDATVRANYIGVTPQVSGHITELFVHDNQRVRKGDPLFIIDPRPYEIALQRAQATLALTRHEVEGLKNGAASASAGISKAEAQSRASAAEVSLRENDPVVADAEIARLEAQFQHADDHLKRLEPLLEKQFVTTDKVDEARTQRAAAAAALDEARARKRAADAGLLATRAQHEVTRAAVEQARTEHARAQEAIGENEGLNARIAVAEAAVAAAKLDVDFCHVDAPFDGKVVNMNISEGAFARSGVDVFGLVDTRTWYVVANFRETQLRHIRDGAPADLYLQSHPGRHYRGKVVGLGWAVLPENGTSVQNLPRVERSLDWIRLAARFPVRIEVEDPDETFRLGASAVATVHGSLRGDP
ncbi:MAG TPA: biotin/lipoyl-binding protein [Candidatus Polarisedimenticolia bacterium]|nr:biotin/lipoyl-binding protein [Candidatus Polarisedimenticolia bacterium]